MKIIELRDKYPLVYEAALNNQQEQGNRKDDYLNLELGKLSKNFFWEDTTEGMKFWSAINRKRFKDAEKICPHLFITITKEFELWTIS